MLSRKKTVTASVSFITGALVVGVSLAPHYLRAAQGPGGGREGDEITELKKRVAKLEAEIAEMRKALVRAGSGALDSATEIKHVREVAKLRTADLLQKAQNTHAILGEIINGKVVGQALQIKINDLNNDLTGLWMTVAGYGLGRDPYLDNIRLSDSGFAGAKLPPDHGIPGPYAKIGLPRLHDRFLEASGAKGKAADAKRAGFEKLVQAYSNPAVYTHRDFNERAYNEYRAGKGLFTPQYVADLNALDQWLTELEAGLGKVPAYFDKAP